MATLVWNVISVTATRNLVSYKEQRIIIEVIFFLHTKSFYIDPQVNKRFALNVFASYWNNMFWAK